jgi:integrase
VASTQAAEAKAAIRSDVPFSGFAKHFLDTHAAVHNKDSEQASKRSIIRNHLFPYFGHRPLGQITREDIARFMAEKLKAGLTRATVNNYWGVLSKMFNCAVEWGYLDASPMRGVKKLRVPDVEIEFYTEDETKRFLDICRQKEPFWLPFFLTTFLTGMRLGELCALRWKDIDFQAGVIHVRRSMWNGIEGTPKNGKTRKIPMHPQVAAALLPKLGKKDDFVFKAVGGTPLTRNSMRKPMTRVQKAAGLREIHFHAAGRHSFASQLVMKGVPLKVVQELLGHATIQMTERYSHLAPSATEDAVRALLADDETPESEVAVGAQLPPKLPPKAPNRGHLRVVQ